MKTIEEIKNKIKEFERKLLDAKTTEESDIIKTKIYSLKWVISELG